MRSSLLALALLLAACAPPPQPPLKLFPLAAVWSQPLEGPVIPPLATDGARVFVTAEGAGLAALDSGTGALVWRDASLEGRLAAGPEALYVLTGEGDLWCLDPRNGRQRWRVRTGIAEGTASVSGDRVLVTGRGAAAYEALAGRRLWNRPEGEPTLGPPGVGGGLLVTVEPGGRVHCRDLETGETLWVRTLAPELIASPAVDETGRVFLGTLEKAFLALDGHEQGRTRWQWKVGTAIHHAGLPLRDRVFVATLEAVVYGLERGSGSMVWRKGLPSRPLAGPTLVGGALMLATQDGHLLGFDPADGRALGSLRLEGEIAAPPIVVGDRFVAALRTRSVTAVSISGAPPEAPLPPQP